jgi:hypothetical protein
MEDQCFTGTSTNNKEPNINIKEMAEKAKNIHDDMLKAMANSFTGFPIKLDKKLEGLAYYVNVSPELYALLENSVNSVPSDFGELSRVVAKNIHHEEHEGARRKLERDIMKNVIQNYKDLWNDFNLFGKIVVFPVMLLCFPIMLIAEWSLK